MGNRQDSSEIAPDIDVQLTCLRREDDFLHQGAQDLAGLQPRRLAIILQCLMESADLLAIERCHFGMEQGRGALSVGQLPLKFRLSTFELDHLGVDRICRAALQDQIEQRTKLSLDLLYLRAHACQQR
ncbi:MAG: hypothetical protein WA702_01915 [Bradyrhizobium sp.]|uniref:hypothetical protein n=1 Tax=Bradyrhizobium sp. TaxID=376 RepID=UPI003C7E1DE4